MEDVTFFNSEKSYSTLDEAIKANPKLIFTRTNNNKKRYSLGTFVAAEGRHRRVKVEIVDGECE